jgi:rod shape-determining protein MreD
MIKKILWALLFIFITILLQSSLARYMHNISPDIVMCIILYVAILNGTLTGEILGFFAGLLLDLMTASPLGTNALIFTVIGALTGQLKGLFFSEGILFPVVSMAIASLIKSLLLFLISIVFSQAFNIIPLIELKTVWQLLINMLIAPFIFAFLGLFKTLFSTEARVSERH